VRRLLGALILLPATVIGAVGAFLFIAALTLTAGSALIIVLCARAAGLALEWSR